MNAKNFYKTRSKKALDKIDELEKQLTAMTADRDSRWRESRSRKIEIDDMTLRIDAMQTAVNGQKNFNEALLAKNLSLVAQIRDIEKRPTTTEPSPINEVQFSLRGNCNYTLTFDRDKLKVIGVAK